MVHSKDPAAESDALEVGKIPDVGYLLTDLVSCSLPLRNPGDVLEWERTSGRATLVVQAGWYRDGQGNRVRMIPYGKTARAILLSLCTEAKRSGSPRVELGENLNQYLGKLGVALGGQQRREVIRMIHAVATMRIDLDVAMTVDGFDGFEESSALITQRRGIYFGTSDTEGQSGLFGPSWVELSPEMWNALQSHSMPVHLGKWAAISAASKSALPLDIYTWLSYRLPHVPNCGTKISWESILNQFGGTDSKVRQARAVWVKALDVVRTVWPEISDRVEIAREGITLRRGRSAVSPKLLKGLPASPADEPSLFDDQEVQP